MRNFDYFNTFFKNKKILITGANGVIGIGITNFFERLILNNCKLKLLLISKSELTIKRNKKIGFKKLDLTSDNFSKNLSTFDYIFHCAGYGQPNKFLEKPLDTVLINTNALIKLSEKINKTGSLIYFSSSEVYNGLSGNNHNETQIGTLNTTNARSSYIESKRCGEAIINSLKNIRAISIRIALAYGPGAKINDERVLNQFIISSIKNKKISMLDDGKKIRSYIFIEDAVNMIINISIRGKQKLYNVGGKESISIYKLAKTIQGITNCKIERPKKYNSNGLLGAPDKVKISINRYEKEFKIFKQKSLQYGLKKTIDWYKNIISNGSKKNPNI